MENLFQEVYAILSSDVPAPLENYRIYVTFIGMVLFFGVLGGRLGWHRQRILPWALGGIILGALIAWGLVGIANLKRNKESYSAWNKARYVVGCVMERNQSRIFVDKERVWFQYDPTFSQDMPVGGEPKGPKPGAISITLRQFLQIEKEVLRQRGLQWPPRQDAPELQGQPSTDH